MEVTHQLLVRNAQVVQVCAKHELVKNGAAMDQVAVVENGSIVVDLQGNIEAIGPVAEIDAQYLVFSSIFPPHTGTASHSFHVFYHLTQSKKILK